MILALAKLLHSATRSGSRITVDMLLYAGNTHVLLNILKMNGSLEKFTFSGTRFVESLSLEWGELLIKYGDCTFEIFDNSLMLPNSVDIPIWKR